MRLHYRFIAVDEAIQAADLLPPRSQAFAGVLCEATGWMMSTAKIDGDKKAAQQRADHLYRRYLEQGAYVPWGRQFGQVCPEPDFDRAARLPRILFVRHARHFVGVHRWPLGACAAGLVAGVIVAFAWWRHRNV